MSILHEKLKAIIAAVDNAFDFANPELVREKAETEFKQAVADEVKALTERVEALEAAAKQAVSSLAPASAAVTIDLAPVSAAVVADTFLGSAPPATDTALDTAIISAMSKPEEDGSAAPAATAE